MTNVIDDVLLAAKRDGDGVKIELTMDDFRRLITALKFADGDWIATTVEWKRDDKESVTIDDQTPVQTPETVAENEPETAECNQSKRERRPNQNLTNKDAKRVFNLARTFPNATMDELDVKAGLYVGTIKYNKKTFVLDFLNDNKEYTLQTIVHAARISKNRFSDDLFTDSDAAEMGISNRFNSD